MELKNRIDKDYITAFKSKDVMSKNLLGTIKGELQTMEKNGTPMTDEAVVALLTKFQKSTKQMIDLGTPGADSELVIINKYLPKQLSEEEVVSIINTAVEEGAKNIGDVMKKFTGLTVDRKQVSTLCKQLLG